MSDRIQRILVTVTVTDANYNTFEATVETAKYETLDAFKRRVEIVIDDRIQRSGGTFVVTPRDP